MYKRQVWIRGNGEAFPEQFGRGALLETVFTETVLVGLLAAAGLLALSHLDVYKRQVRNGKH